MLKRAARVTSGPLTYHDWLQQENHYKNNHFTRRRKLLLSALRGLEKRGGVYTKSEKQAFSIISGQQLHSFHWKIDVEDMDSWMEDRLEEEDEDESSEVEEEFSSD